MAARIFDFLFNRYIYLLYLACRSVVLNPIGTVPLFIAITQNMKKEERKAVSKTAIITSGIVLVVFAIAGYRDSQAFWNHNIQLYCWRSASIHCSHWIVDPWSVEIRRQYSPQWIRSGSSCFPITRRAWCNHFCNNLVWPFGFVSTRFRLEPLTNCFEMSFWYYGDSPK